MGKPDFHALYSDPLDAECCEGYYDGSRPDSPEPSGNRHPAYIHGFRNARDDRASTPRRTADQIRADWAFIVATCSEARNDAP